MKKSLRVVAILAAIVAIALLGRLDAADNADKQQWLIDYCEGVAIWEAEVARSVPLNERVGTRPWRDNVNIEEACPGMRPAK